MSSPLACSWPRRFCRLKEKTCQFTLLGSSGCPHCASERPRCLTVTNGVTVPIDNNSVPLLRARPRALPEILVLQPRFRERVVAEAHLRLPVVLALQRRHGVLSPVRLPRFVGVVPRRFGLGACPVDSGHDHRPDEAPHASQESSPVRRGLDPFFLPRARDEFDHIFDASP